MQQKYAVFFLLNLQRALYKHRTGIGIAIQNVGHKGYKTNVIIEIYEYI